MSYWSREQEDAVITAVVAKDESAFEMLFQQYLPLVNKWFRELNFQARILDRDDWHQECRLVLMTTVRRYEGRQAGEFGTYFRLNVRNRGFDLKRRQNALKRRHEQMSESLDAKEAETLRGQLPSPQPDGLSLLQLQDQLVLLLQSLSDFERQVWQALVAGDSVEYIARTFECSSTKVRNAINRCHGKALAILLTVSDN